MQTDSMILRVETFPPLTTKGSELTWPEADQNLIKIYQDLVAKIQAGSVPDYDSGKTYSTFDAANYASKTWSFVNITPSSGVTPGSDPAYWVEIDPTVLAHQKDRDQYLDFGGPNQVSADALKVGVGTRITASLTKAQVNALHTTPVALYTPPVGKVARFIKAPVMLVKPDGTTFLTGSGQKIQLMNPTLVAAASGRFMAEWGNGLYAYALGPDKYSQAATYSDYDMDSGVITATTTDEISGGGVDAEIFFFLDIELFDE